MIANFYTDHCHRIIVDDFMYHYDLFKYNEQFKAQYENANLGTISYKGLEKVDLKMKQRLEFDIHTASTQQGLALSSIWQSYIWSASMRAFYNKCGGIFPYMNVSSFDSLLGAFYGEGGFYQPHSDHCILTAIFFHGDHTTFRGGSFFLGDKINRHDPDIKYLEISPIKNRLVIFPSRYIHYAEPVHKSYEPGIEGMRLCTQNFIDLYK